MNHMKALIHPQLQRYLWTEFSPERLLIPLILVTLSAWLLYTLSIPVDSVFLFVANFIFSFVAAFAAISVVQNEMIQQTWDQQRLSGFSPWEMTWTMALGAPAYWIYVGLVSLTFALGFNLSSDIWEKTLLLGLQSLLVAAFMIALGFCFGLHIYSTQYKRSAFFRIILLLFIIFLANSLIGMTAELTQEQTNDISIWTGLTQGAINYYGQAFDAFWFLMVNLVIWTAWFLLSATRMLARILGEHLIPWASLVFLLFASGWLIGYFPPNILQSAHVDFFLHALALISCLGFYYSLLIFPPTGLLVKRWLIRWQGFRARRTDLLHLLRYTPPWVVIWLLMLLVTLIIAVKGPGGLGSSVFKAAEEDVESTHWLMDLIWNPVNTLAVFVLLMLRDAFIIARFCYSHSRRTLSAALVTLLILHFLLPSLLEAIGATTLSRLVQPQPWMLPGTGGQNILLGYIVAIAHCWLAGWWYLLRWKTNQKA